MKRAAKYINPKTVATTLLTSWLIWVSSALVELKTNVGKLSVYVCILAHRSGEECPAELAELETPRTAIPDPAFGIEPELASPIFSFPETRKESRHEKVDP